MNLENDFYQRIDEIKTLILNDEALHIKGLIEVFNIVMTALRAGNKIVFIGNGGSAAEAMHIAAEFTGKCVVDHRPLPVLCFSESQSAITSIANDYGFEFIFVRQIQALMSKEDVLIALTTSGRSKNIVNAINEAKVRGIKTIMWSGECETPDNVDFHLKVPSKSTPRIQEVHLMWGHLLAEIVEIRLPILEI